MGNKLSELSKPVAPLRLDSYMDGWNACRAAMLAAAPEGGN